MNEHMGGARADFNLTSKMKLFYRFNHDDNIGVTGFGGVGLSAFGNSNSANSHAVGWDYSSGSWVHGVRFSFLKFINGIVDANALAGTPILPVQVNITGLGGFVYRTQCQRSAEHLPAEPADEVRRQLGEGASQHPVRRGI